MPYKNSRRSPPPPIQHELKTNRSTFEKWRFYLFGMQCQVFILTLKREQPELLAVLPNSILPRFAPTKYDHSPNNGTVCSDRVERGTLTNRHRWRASAGRIEVQSVLECSQFNCGAAQWSKKSDNSRLMAPIFAAIPSSENTYNILHRLDVRRSAIVNFP